MKFHHRIVKTHKVVTLRSRQNGWHFADDSSKYIFLNENERNLNKNSLNFIPKGPVNNIPALVQLMAWRRPGASHYQNQLWLICFINDSYSIFPTAWWRHQMETFSALLAICAGNSPVPGEFPTQRPVTRSFDVYFDLRPNGRLSKQSWGWWFETLSRSLWRHRNGFTHILHDNSPAPGQSVIIIKTCDAKPNCRYVLIHESMRDVEIIS